MPTSDLALEDPLEPFTAGSFPALQFKPSQKPFVAGINVPIAEFQFVEMPTQYRPFNPSNDVHTIDGGVPQSSPSFHLD